ncbi:Os08g0507350 [Oryza sativa Japonica Group]|uniref:Os08g0507350 protein n=1 Tax=Oryza sativa subsp. japonica TaxID=39947 RepID=Q6Z3D8_ORYSJ|nr:unknown protein [Oryza sativa Japonica Group]BAD10233.1 unknown protein [Oryza sativa Japonica Group]BAH94380.1 Os08g0507350 [Oryza sativa Japonica Group]|eukprot:NP_001175652.1 Os08g0507350 [Oryza sativa Japonica Group]
MEPPYAVDAHALINLVENPSCHPSHLQPSSAMAQLWRPCASSLQAPPQPVGSLRSFSAPPLAAAGSPSAGLPCVPCSPAASARSGGRRRRLKTTFSRATDKPSPLLLFPLET